MGYILIKNEGDCDKWTSNALLDVPDAQRFSIKIKPFSAWEDNACLVGIAPKDTDLTQKDIEEHVGVFIMLSGTNPELYVAGSGSWSIEVPGWDDTEILELQMTYENNKLYFSVEGHPRVQVEKPIPEADYRPCFSFGRLGSSYRVTVVTLPCKRKLEHNEAPAGKITKRLWASKQFSDASIVCGGTAIPVHRCVLAAASPFFERAFEAPMREAAQATVVIEDTDLESVEKLLSYLYTGDLGRHCNPDCAALAALLSLAHRLDVVELLDHCAASLVTGLNELNVAQTVAALRPYKDDLAQHWDAIADLVQADGRLVRAIMAPEPAPPAVSNPARV